MGSIHSFDSETSKSGIPPVGYDGRLVEGVAGVNIPLGERFFVGVEGNAAKGVDGDIDWEYWCSRPCGRAHARQCKIYGKVGYRWVNFDKQALAGSDDYHDMTYGAGFEVSPGGAASKAAHSRRGRNLRQFQQHPSERRGGHGLLTAGLLPAARDKRPRRSDPAGAIVLPAAGLRSRQHRGVRRRGLSRPSGP